MLGDYLIRMGGGWLFAFRVYLPTLKMIEEYIESKVLYKSITASYYCTNPHKPLIGYHKTHFQTTLDTYNLNCRN